jgi:hypothetical protein
MGISIAFSSPIFMEETNISQILSVGSATVLSSPILLEEIVGEILSVASSSASSPTSMKRIVNEILQMGSSTTSSITFMEETDISHIVLMTFITYLNGRKYRFCVFTRWGYWSVFEVDLGRAVICMR